MTGTATILDDDIAVDPGVRVGQIVAGANHSCVLMDDGTIRCWGGAGGSLRVLGDGSTQDATTPVQVFGIADAVAIAAGASHTCALRADGSVSCWGSNVNGQLGNGTRTAAAIPTPVNGITSAVSVAAGANHTCAVLGDGTARCWGAGGSGRLGNGGTSNSSVPVTVSGLTGATSIAAGGTHSCAVLSDGGARCWGNGGSGRLGNFSTSSSATPVVVWLSGAVGIAAGENHTCATLDMGGARCWGAGGDGQLGTGGTANSVAPVPVSDLSLVAGLAAGVARTCAARTDGSVACWGRGSSGQLGNGTTSGTNVPAAVPGLPDLDPPSIPNGVVSTLAGSVDGFVDDLGAAARFGSLGGMDRGPSGDLFVVDRSNFSVRRVTPSGAVTTYAGTGSRGSVDGPAATAQFYSPVDLAVAEDGTVYVAEAVSELSAGLFGLQVVNRIRRISPSGEVTTFAGGGAGGYVDGVGLAARFAMPTAITMGPDGNVYVADTGNHRIRRVTPDGEVTTVMPDDGSLFFGLTQLAVDDDGRIAFTGPESRIRVLDSGPVSTLVGTSTSDAVDGAPDRARFASVGAMAFDADGSLLVADVGARRLRRVAPDGRVTTVAGAVTGFADGTGTAARFSAFLTGLAVDPTGSIYVADSGNRRIRSVSDG